MGMVNPGNIRIPEPEPLRIFLECQNEGTIGCTPDSVPMVFIVFSSDS